jgi:hypothetical protein
MNIPDLRRSLLAILAAILCNLLFPLPQGPMNHISGFMATAAR